MASSDINITAHVTTLRWSQAQIDNEISFLRGTSSFRSLIADVSPTIRGRELRGIVITDSAEDFSSGKWKSSEQVQFNINNGILYVGINPNETAYNQRDNRILTVGELIAHGLGHFTDRAAQVAAENPDDIFGYSQEPVAVMYANRLAREFGLSETIATQVSTSKYGPLFCTIKDPSGNYKQPIYLQRCFLKGTPISVGYGIYKYIEEITTGDNVLSFEKMKNDVLQSKSVTNIFRNITTQIIDLRGLRCTPGHVFLTSDKNSNDTDKFDTIFNILKEDKTIVREDGVSVRARTGTPIGSINDSTIRVVYQDYTNCGMKRLRTVLLRLGIIVPNAAFDKTVNPHAIELSLSHYLEKNGVTILCNGSLLDKNKVQHAACDWPEGSTPLDTCEMQNWVVEVDGQPYTPPWILALKETDDTEGLHVVGQELTLTPASESVRQHAL